jgi:Restriction endonuclease
MFHDAKDIDFMLLGDREFEDLCFQLLDKVGFINLTWRQGSGDQGRDLEGERLVNDELCGTYAERWFFECKRYSKGVPVEKLHSKLAWADAESPDHLVFMISSYVSTSAREWLKKRQKKVGYRIHVIEGPQLKKVLLNYRGLAESFFANKNERLLSSSIGTWRSHGLIPEPRIVAHLLACLPVSKLSIFEVAFLFCSALNRQDELEDLLVEDGDDIVPSLHALFRELLQTALKTDDPGHCELTLSSFEDAESDHLYSRYLTCDLFVARNHALYSGLASRQGAGVEVLVVGDDDLTVRVNYAESGMGVLESKGVTLFDRIFNGSIAKELFIGGD